MRPFLFAVTLLVLLSSAANAGPREEALQIIDKWTTAFTNSDVDGIAKLYAPDALFLGGPSKSIITTNEGIRHYFEAALSNNKPRGAKLTEIIALVISENIVTFTGFDELSGVRDGPKYSTRLDKALS
jgi:hypothetical protein